MAEEGWHEQAALLITRAVLLNRIVYGGSMAKRELIEVKGDKRYVRRDDHGRFTESDDVGRSLSQDVRQRAKTTVTPGHGDKGDQKRKK
jgi:hypothetical protein